MRSTCSTSIRPWPGKGSARSFARRSKSLRKRAARPNSPPMRATPPSVSSRVAVLCRNGATRCRATTNGLPTPRSRRFCPPPKGARHETSRNAVSAPLALLHRAQGRDRRCRRGYCVETPRSMVSAMPRERLYLFDTTLRDGAQTNGVDFTLHDKLAIAALLDDLGIDYVEAGYPGANPTDTSLFAEKRPMRATLTAFGMTRRPGRSASNDPGLVALLDAKADAICFVAKSWDYHVRVALETTEEENLASIRDSVTAAKAKGREVLLDCEHFFDGYKANPDYALACAKAAYEE